MIIYELEKFGKVDVLQDRHGRLRSQYSSSVSIRSITSFTQSFISIGVVLAEKLGRSLPSNFCRHELTSTHNEISALRAFQSFQPNPRAPTVSIIDPLRTRKAQKPTAN